MTIDKNSPDEITKLICSFGFPPPLYSMETEKGSIYIKISGHTGGKATLCPHALASCLLAVSSNPEFPDAYRPSISLQKELRLFEIGIYESNGIKHGLVRPNQSDGAI